MNEIASNVIGHVGIIGVVVLAACHVRAPSVEAVQVVSTDPRFMDNYLHADSARLVGTLSPDTTLLKYDSTVKYQEIDGYGATLTDSSVVDINRLSRGPRQQLLRLLFDPKRGLNMNFLRVPLGASSSSLHDYTYLDLPPGREDLELKGFSLDEARSTISLLKEIKSINPNLRIILSPWTAPGWMKTTDSTRKGVLRHDRLDVYARYLLKTITAYEQAGLRPWGITIQNEPMFSLAEYPSMEIELDDQVALIREHLGPLLHRLGEPVRILGLDFNYDLHERGREIFVRSGGFLAGTAFHCYGGSPSDMKDFVSAIYQTECSGLTTSTASQTLHWWISNEVIAAGLLGSKLAMGWNLVLDEKHGPALYVCDICRGLIDLEGDSFVVNPELVALAHAGKFLTQGARRIETGAPVDPGYSYIGYINPDGTCVLVIENRGDKRRSFGVASGSGRYHEFAVPADGVTTVTFSSSR
jgi:glucosylceramidase